MDYARRVALLRVIILVAIAVSAVLTVDHVSPGRDFCPLAEACAAAQGSALGSIGGIPTSVIGMGAFGALLLLTLLPLEWSRPLLKPAGVIAALAGVGLVAYQRFVLKSYCPLCLVADGAGILAGLLAVTWPRLPARRSGRHIRWEGGASRVAWTMAGLLAAAVPFAIPRPDDPGWVEITPLADGAFEQDESLLLVIPPKPPAGPVAADATASRPPPEDRTTPPAPAPAPADEALPAGDPPAGAAPAPIPPLVTASPEPEPPSPPPVVSAPPAPAPRVEAPEEASDAARVEPPAVAAPADEPPDGVAPAATDAPSEGDAVPPPAPEPEPAPQGPLLVEYLNAFCGHCRATHKRLASVLAETGADVRRRRVYTWAGKKTPTWARACAYAATLGLEDRMFEELMRARRQSLTEIEAAARRAGVDVAGLRTYLAGRVVAPRLARDRRLVLAARIRKLPTIDIGRRRLMGSQSTAELREALLAAAGRQ